jgi:16S rRNA (uracil1498-N3)-methyltransferase
VNLIILEPGEIGPSGLADLAGVRAIHLLKVLGVATGDSVRIGLLDGPHGIGVVESVDATGGDDPDGQTKIRPSVVLRCRFEAALPPRPPVDLLLALPRPKVMRRLWAQLAALGVDRIILTNAAKVERQYFDTHFLAPEVYTPLLIEGLQQAKATRLPRVSVHKRLKVLIEDDLTTLSAVDIRLMAEPAAPAVSVVMNPVSESARVLLAVGPEGGWNEFEHRLLSAHGFVACGLGARTLRTDTACIALIAIVNERLQANSAVPPQTTSCV